MIRGNTAYRYPPAAQRAGGDFSLRYKFNGKELDKQTGYYYYGARYYDPVLSRWLSVDPLAEKYPGFSPYNFTLNSPVMRVDKNGKNENPIYDKQGNFLGTDDKGLQGEAIIMRKEDFKQGMSHYEAILYGRLYSQLSKGEQTYMILRGMYAHWKFYLPSRPDWDGVVTVEDAEKWFQEGGGKPLYVDISKMNFFSSDVSVEDLRLNRRVQINFFNKFNIHPFNEDIKWRPASDYTLSRVYGTLRIILINPETGEIDLERGFNNDPNAFDTYDFGFPYGIIKHGTPFNFYGYGIGHVKIHPLRRGITVNPLGGYLGSKF